MQTALAIIAANSLRNITLSWGTQTNWLSGYSDQSNLRTDAESS